MIRGYLLVLLLVCSLILEGAENSNTDGREYGIHLRITFIDSKQIQARHFFSPKARLIFAQRIKFIKVFLYLWAKKIDL